MTRRKVLLLATFGGKMEEVITGLRSLPHDHMVLITNDRGCEECSKLLSLLEKLRVEYDILLLEDEELIRTSTRIEEVIRKYHGMGWRAMVDITGGGKLLSDAAALAAVATGSEICCFEGKSRHISLFKGLGVSELIPEELANIMTGHKWPMSLEDMRNIGVRDRSWHLLLKMKNMDMVEVQGEGLEARLHLTKRGQASLDWLNRMDGIT